MDGRSAAQDTYIVRLSASDDASAVDQVLQSVRFAVNTFTARLSSPDTSLRMSVPSLCRGGNFRSGDRLMLTGSRNVCFVYFGRKRLGTMAAVLRSAMRQRNDQTAPLLAMNDDDPRALTTLGWLTFAGVAWMHDDLRHSPSVWD
nr:hypothetical protein CFP56_75867 [Quercus suber]